MNEKQTPSGQEIRPTKKQRELLSFIEVFIAEHGYSPSYREIMSGLEYTSVATVALHVNNLIKRGHLIKRDHSARSLELVNSAEKATLTTNLVGPNEEKWLIDRVEHAFRNVEQMGQVSKQNVGDLSVLLAALKVLGLEGGAGSFTSRLAQLKSKVVAD